MRNWKMDEEEELGGANEEAPAYPYNSLTPEQKKSLYEALIEKRALAESQGDASIKKAQNAAKWKSAGAGLMDAFSKFTTAENNYKPSSNVWNEIEAGEEAKVNQARKDKDFASKRVIEDDQLQRNFQDREFQDKKRGRDEQEWGRQDKEWADADALKARIEDGKARYSKLHWIFSCPKAQVLKNEKNTRVRSAARMDNYL